MISAVTERVLITGAGGFVGRRLVARLKSEWPDWTLLQPGFDGVAGETPEPFDIVDAETVLKVVARFAPTIVVHLAAISAVTDASRDPRKAWEVNLTGTLNLVSALQKEAPNCRLLHVSTSEVYGASLGATGGTDESALLQPLTTYAASKAAADILVRQAAESGLHVVVARPFNHTGPGQSETFMVPNFAAQVARIEAGLQPPVINVGDLDSERDFLDVRDVISAYTALLGMISTLRRGEVFNISSGKSRRVGEILEVLLSLSTVGIDVRVDPTRLRGTSVQRVRGNAEKIRMTTSWEPSIIFDQTLTDILGTTRESFGVKP